MGCQKNKYGQVLNLQGYKQISTNKEARWSKASHPVIPLKLYFKSLVGKCLTNEIKLGKLRDTNQI